VARPRQCDQHLEIESGTQFVIKPSADKMTFSDGTDEYDCHVTMQLVGKFLVVGDNLHCGGANLTFSGVYQSKR
jgi:hypothetical protein